VYKVPLHRTQKNKAETAYWFKEAVFLLAI
jgi:hypothetical protein